MFVSLQLISSSVTRCNETKCLVILSRHRSKIFTSKSCKMVKPRLGNSGYPKVSRADQQKMFAGRKLADGILKDFHSITNSYTRSIIQNKEPPNRSQRFGLTLYLMGNGMPPANVMRFFRLNWKLTNKQLAHVHELIKDASKKSMETAGEMSLKYYDEHQKMWLPFWVPT